MNVPIAPSRTWLLLAAALGVSAALEVLVLHYVVQAFAPMLLLTVDVVGVVLGLAIVVASLSPLWRCVRLDDDRWAARMGWFAGASIDPGDVAAIEQRPSAPLESWGNRLEDGVLHLVGRAEWPRTRWVLGEPVPCRAGFGRGVCSSIEFTHPPEVTAVGRRQV